MNMDDILSQGLIYMPRYHQPLNWGRSVCQGMFLHFHPEVVPPKHTTECLVLFIPSSPSAKARVVLNSITIVTIRLLVQISTENCLTFQTNLAQIHNFSEPGGIERVAQLNRSPALCQVLLICWSWCLDTESKASSTSACELCLAYGCPKAEVSKGESFSTDQSAGCTHFWVQLQYVGSHLPHDPWVPHSSALGAGGTCLPIPVLFMKGWDCCSAGKSTAGAWLLLLIVTIRTLEDAMWWRDSWV